MIYRRLNDPAVVFTSDIDFSVFQGSPYLLTSREIDVLRLMVEGLTSEEAAEKLSLSERTIEVHRSSILRKFRAKTSAHLVSLVWSNLWARSKHLL